MVREWIARIGVLLIIAGLPLAALGYQYGLRPHNAHAHTFEIVAAAPEAGGFSPASLRVPVGEKITLRFSSPDVTHGIAFGPGLDIAAQVVDPGQVITFNHTFEQPGIYTYYCNVWCGADHWRMRGVIEVYDPAQPAWMPPAQSDPVIASLAADGVNIDANVPIEFMPGMPVDEHQAHAADAFTLSRTPSPDSGAALIDQLHLPDDLLDPAWRQTHTPNEALQALAHHNPDVAVDDLADVVAHLWLLDRPIITEATITLYNQNCAACHGISGGGDGLAADQTAVLPSVFSDAGYMFTMRDDVLYAKIRRGGMGTDMPNFGTLFTPEETWALVDYLRTMVGDEQP